MAYFAYKAADQRGQTIDGVMEASDARSVVERLQRDAYFPIQVAPQGERVALSGLAIFLGASALEQKHNFESSGRTDVAAHDSAATLRTWTNVAWGGAAVSGGTGLYLLFLTPKIEL